MIHTEIIEKRIAAAPQLKKIIDTCDECSQALTALQDASSGVEGITASFSSKLNESMNNLQAVRNRAEKRYDRFAKGLITIAVAGLEKMGKTTLLKTLTGIKDLPTAIERCTAVPCEIIYHETKASFDLEFHTEESLIKEVISTLIDGFHQKQQQITIPAPNTLNEFAAMSLPPIGNFEKGTAPYKALKSLHDLKDHSSSIRSYLGKGVTQNLPLSELDKWVAQKSESMEKARIFSVRACTIYTKFDGGSENLRWLDTPGVNDPSPIARERTIRSIDREADLLLLATRPLINVSPEDSFTEFWTTLMNLPQDAVTITKRLRVFLNWTQAADPNQKLILSHRRCLEDDYGISSFSGPYRAGVPDHEGYNPTAQELADVKADVASLMSEINAQLRDTLPRQDEQTISQIEADFRSVLAKIRTEIYDYARKLHPGDASLSNHEMDYFEKWFLDVKANGKNEGFFPKLRDALQRAVGAMESHPEVQTAQKSFTDFFTEKAKAIQASLPTATDMEILRVQQAGNPPIFTAMQNAIQDTYSDLVNELSKKVRGFGPVMQDIVIQVLRDAGLGALLPSDKKGKDCLLACYEKLKEYAPAEGNPVLEALEDVIALEDSLKHVYRHEMRPAVNLFNSLLWKSLTENQALPAPAERLRRLMELHAQTTWANEVKQYFETTPLPGGQDSDEKHAAFFTSMNKYAIRGIGCVINHGPCRFAVIADDVMRDCQSRLTFSDYVRQAWSRLLMPLRGELLAQQIGALRANSENIAKFRRTVVALDEKLKSAAA